MQTLAQTIPPLQLQRVLVPREGVLLLLLLLVLLVLLLVVLLLLVDVVVIEAVAVVVHLPMLLLCVHCGF